MKRTCTIDSCNKPARSNSATMCPMHYHRWYRHGDPHLTSSGKSISQATNSQYKRIYRPRHPVSGKTGMAYEHRVNLFDSIGPGTHECNWCKKPITWGTGRKGTLQVDHLDRDRTNNNPKNLVPSCASCNTTRGRGQWSEKLQKQGFFSSHDTVGRLAPRKYDSETMEPHLVAREGGNPKILGYIPS